MAAAERLLQPTDHVYDLVDRVDDRTPGVKGEEEIIVIDGRVYERVLKPEDRIYDLHDALEGGGGDNFRTGAMDEEIRKMAAETAERIAREIIPGIAERVIREEIEKLKREDGHGAE